MATYNPFFFRSTYKDKKGPEYYTRQSSGLVLWRCPNCWPYVSNFDNGFISASRPYPHREWCPNIW